VSGLLIPLDAPAVVRYNLGAIDELVRSVREGSYCAVLGPRLSGKTMLLRYVARFLAAPLGWTCIYIDLYDLEASTLSGFFGDLIQTVAREGEAATGHTLLATESTRLAAEAASSAVFRAFLDEVVLGLERDLVIIVEHLEALPTDLVEALLTSLRAAYMDQQTLDHRVVVIVSGALSLAALTVGESSPFRGIARRIFVGDLSREQSQALIAEQLEAGGISFTANAQRRLLEAGNGDPYLIRRLCSHCLEQAGEGGHLRARHVQAIVADFLRDEVYGYAPLQEAIRLVEDDPDLLRCILLLLAHGEVPRSDLPLPLSPDLDPLYLTGVVEPIQAGLSPAADRLPPISTQSGSSPAAERSSAGDGYRIQNQIYRDFLDQHFHPGRVGHLLSMAGRWDAALDYLEAGAREGNEQARADLLPATINSMYAAEDVAGAAHFLTRGLTAAFGVVEARVWSAQTAENRLRLVGYVGPRANTTLWASPEMPLTVDRLEARAYRQGRALRGPEGGRYIWRALPLLVPAESTRAGRPVGVVMLCDDLQLNPRVDQRDRDLQLTGYLSQASRAFHAVGVRRQELALAGRMQTSLLPGAPPQIDGWQIAATLRPARETSGDFYDFLPLPGGRLGLAVADVTDKGMAAALYMALCRTLLRTYAAEHPNRPDLALAAVNQRLLADTDAGLFVTLFYGILDPVAGTLTYCNAGHHPPYLLQPRVDIASPDAAGVDTAGLDRGALGAVSLREASAAESGAEGRNNGSQGITALAGRGIALGVVGEPRWGYSTVELPPGGLLLIYTDGVVDALSPDGERFGVEQMLTVARNLVDQPPDQVQARLLAVLQQFMGQQPQFDDVTLVAIRREPWAAELPAERVRRRELRSGLGRTSPMWPAAQRGPLDDGQA
jgi:serine phosphatase RsbU (regulator of sigma subunit)